MKKILTTAAIVAAMTLPAFAEGDDPSTKAGEPQGTVKATTDMKQDQSGSGAMGQAIRRSTTGSGSSANQLNKEESSSPVNPGQKTGVSGGADGGGSGGSGGSGGGADSR